MGSRVPLLRTVIDTREMKRKLAMRTAEIGLPVRTTNCLEEHGILTVADLLNHTPRDLLAITGFGEKTLEAVYSCLEGLGFSRRPDYKTCRPRREGGGDAPEEVQYQSRGPNPIPASAKLRHEHAVPNETPVDPTVLELVIRFFGGDEEAARRWLRTPCLALNNQTPEDVARTKHGAEQVKRVIGALEHGVYL